MLETKTSEMNRNLWKFFHSIDVLFVLQSLKRIEREIQEKKIFNLTGIHIRCKRRKISIIFFESWEIVETFIKLKKFYIYKRGT